MMFQAQQLYLSRGKVTNMNWFRSLQVVRVGCALTDDEEKYRE